MHRGIHIHSGGTTLWIYIRHWTQSVTELEENLQMKKKLGLNRLSDFLKVMQRGAHPGLLTSNSLLSLYNMVAIVFKQLFHFKSKCHFKGQEITCMITGVFFCKCWQLCKSFSTFLSLPQHPPVTNTALLLLQQGLRIFFQVLLCPWVHFPPISLLFLFF